MDVNGLYFTLYIIFGTNLLTRGPTQIAVFCLFQCFEGKGYQTESKRNETFGNVIFGTNMIQRTWSGHQAINEAATRHGGAPTPLGAPSPSWAPRSSPDRPLSPIYTHIPWKHQIRSQNTFPSPQPFVPVRSHLGAFSGTPPEEALIMEGFYINTIASPMMCE